jgi:hypothetical protein
MCTQKPPYDFSEQLYKRYKQAFENYIGERVRHCCWHRPLAGRPEGSPPGPPRPPPRRCCRPFATTATRRC